MEKKRKKRIETESWSNWSQIEMFNGFIQLAEWAGINNCARLCQQSAGGASSLATPKMIIIVIIHFERKSDGKKEKTKSRAKKQEQDEQKEKEEREREREWHTHTRRYIERNWSRWCHSLWWKSAASNRKFHWTVFIMRISQNCN